MLRVLTTRRWMAWLAIAVIASVACFFLGRWQWNRWETRHEAQTTVNANYDAAPAPLRDVLRHADSRVTDAKQWRAVRLTGQYDSDAQVLVRNRPLEGSYGYEVALPFTLTGGGAILINRGWVQNGPTANSPPPVPSAPEGPVTVTGWLRPAEDDLGRSPVNGQVSSIRPELVDAQGGPELMPNAYVRMESEKPAPPERPKPLGKPDLGSAAGVNLSYAVQWWLGMIAFPVIVVLAARRELPGRATKEPKPKKTRIWDEEDA